MLHLGAGREVVVAGEGQPAVAGNEDGAGDAGPLGRRLVLLSFVPYAGMRRRHEWRAKYGDFEVESGGAWVHGCRAGGLDRRLGGGAGDGVQMDECCLLSYVDVARQRFGFYNRRCFAESASMSAVAAVERSVYYVFSFVF